MEFWEACENYIQGNIETAIDDRRHDPIEHLAVAKTISRNQAHAWFKNTQYTNMYVCMYQQLYIYKWFNLKKSLVTWSIFNIVVDQKQITNFVWPYLCLTSIVCIILS